MAAMLYTAILFLLVVTAGTAPAVIVALYYLWDGGPRLLRPWFVVSGTFRRQGGVILLAWALAPVGLAHVAVLVFVLQPLGVTGVLVSWLVAAVLVGYLAERTYQALWAGVSIGLATFAAPLVAILLETLATDPPLSLGPILIGIPLVWNPWVIATIVKAESPGLRAGSHHCRRCGYDLGAMQNTQCPECGAPIAGRAAQLQSGKQERVPDDSASAH